MTTSRILAIASLLPLAAACAVESGDHPQSSQPGHDERTAQSEAPLTTEGRWQSWTNGGAEVALGFTAQQGLCYLTEVSGAFRGWGDGVRLRTWNDGTWHLGGAAGSGWMQAGARCVSNKEMFNDTAGYLTTYSASYTYPSCPWGIACPAGSGGTVVQLQSTAGSVCTLSAVNGEFNGNGEGAVVRQNNNGNWELYVFSHSGAGVSATATCMQGYGHAYPWQTDSWTQGNPPTWELYPPGAFCNLSGLAGRFRGWGEGVEIQQATNGSSQQWQLTGWSQQSGITGYSECWLSMCKLWNQC
jgi:hypothetical protein